MERDQERKKIKSLQENIRNKITAFQDKNQVAWEENITLWGEKYPLEKCQNPTNGWSGGLGENLDQ